MPSLFPLQAFEEFVNSAREATLVNSEARHEFGGASNIIGWRFRACVEDKEGYMASWRQYGAGASFEALYLRERLFFGIFVSGVSCIEATVYGCYALASDPSIFSLKFDETTRRHRSGPQNLLKQLQHLDQSLELVSVLQRLVSCDEWKLWKEFRNTMTHRRNLPRIIYASLGGPLPTANPFEFAATWSTRALSEDETFLDEQLYWLSDSIEQLFHSGTKLAHRSRL